MTDNKLIAKFMGWTPCDSNDNTMYANPQDKSDAWSTDEMRFHESWDWLMPVVQKIESLGYVFTIQGGKAEYGEMISETRCFIAEDKLSSTYKAVVEFIKDWPHAPYTDSEGNTYI